MVSTDHLNSMLRHILAHLLEDLVHVFAGIRVKPGGDPMTRSMIPGWHSVPPHVLEVVQEVRVDLLLQLSILHPRKVRQTLSPPKDWMPPAVSSAFPLPTVSTQHFLLPSKPFRM